jgi:hypothetical protein
VRSIYSSRRRNLSKNNSRRYKRYRNYKSKKGKGPRLICPICNRPLNLTITAIEHQESGKKAHFDCILKELKKSYQLNPKEEMIYLGGGSFGIIERVKGKNTFGFIIKRRFQYENRDH